MIPTEAVEYVSPNDLNIHPDNPRRGDVDSIVDSIKSNGWFGTLVAQRSTGRVIAGNHRLMAARRLGLEQVPVYWVDVDDQTALRILIADNRTSDLATYDDKSLVDILTRINTETSLLGTGYDGADLAALSAVLTGVEDDHENNYSRKIEAPVYEPTGPCPDVAELVDSSKTSELEREIVAVKNLPNDVREFLIHAAQRHTEFRFDRIAEFYAHAAADIQHLFERSGLVIIDLDDAIANGFVALDKRLIELYVEEHGNAEHD